MEGMEEKLSAIMNNPQMMQQIMSMASTLSGSQESPLAAQQEPELPSFDPALLKKIMGMAGHLGVDPQQKALLHALKPYLSDIRVQKLEKAMRAAKLANLASSALNSGALSFLTGR